MEGKADIYSVAGFFNNGFPKGVCVFGGFLNTQQRALDLQVEGMLVDCFGRSFVRGNITGNEMHWFKKYSNRSYEIDYIFHKNKDELWIGEYSHPDVGRGVATCKLDLFFKNFEFAKMQTLSPEEIAENMVQGLLDKGLIIPCDDSSDKKR